MKNTIIFVLVSLLILVGMVGLLWQFGETNEKPIEGVAGEMRHVKGEGEIVVVEFSDFQCPACKAVGEPLRQILDKYQGKVRLVFRHFPLTSIHRNALSSASAAEAAGRQGKFWEMHDKLFLEQESWEAESDPRESYYKYADDLGLDVDKFKADLEGSEVKQAVNLDLSAATRYQLAGTPSFFVNGEKIEFGSLEVKLAELTK